LKPRLHKQNLPPQVEERAILIALFYSEKTGRLKPRLHKQNLPPQVEERAILIALFYSVRGGGLRFCRSGFNRRLREEKTGRLKPYV